MNICKIIREEVDEFDWIRGIEPRYLKVNDLEVGKTYRYLPDLDAYHIEGDEELPEWLSDYSGKELTIDRITTNKPWQDRLPDIDINTIGYDYDPNDFSDDYIIYFTWVSHDLGVETRMSAGTNFFRWAKFQELL